MESPDSSSWVAKPCHGCLIRSGNDNEQVLHQGKHIPRTLRRWRRSRHVHHIHTAEKNRKKRNGLNVNVSCCLTGYEICCFVLNYGLMCLWISSVHGLHGLNKKLLENVLCVKCTVFCIYSWWNVFKMTKIILAHCQQYSAAFIHILCDAYNEVSHQ